MDSAISITIDELLTTKCVKIEIHTKQPNRCFHKSHHQPISITPSVIMICSTVSMIATITYLEVDCWTHGSSKMETITGKVHKGIGSYLMMRCEEIASFYGCNTIELDDVSDCCGFFESSGYHYLEPGFPEMMKHLEPGFPEMMKHLEPGPHV